MKKPVIIFGVILLFMIAVAAIFFRSSPGASPATSSSGTTNDGPRSSLSDESRKNFPTGDTLLLGTPSGSVTVKNFYKGITQSIDEPGDLIVKDATQFSIIYNVPTSNFDLFVKQKPVQESRTAAEKEFLSILGLRESSACKLSAQITVPYDLDQNLGGRQYPLSFCINKVQ